MYKFSLKDNNFLPHLGCQIELSLGMGEILILTGENGVGKTTLLSKIFSKNQDIISYAMQSPLDIFYDRKLVKLKSLFLEISKGVLNSELFHELWVGFGLSKKENRMLSTLSGGEAQALKLSFTMSLNKEVFFLDEPRQFLDEANKDFLHQALKKLISFNKSILIIDHEIDWIGSDAKAQVLEVIEGVLQKGRTWTI
jgi:energy-coupling factor transporter ATP-binding protein EcfA2